VCDLASRAFARAAGDCTGPEEPECAVLISVVRDMGRGEGEVTDDDAYG